MRHIRIALIALASVFWSVMIAGTLASMFIARRYPEICRFDYGWHCDSDAIWINIIAALARIPTFAFFASWFALPSPLWFGVPFWLTASLSVSTWIVYAGTALLLIALLRQLGRWRARHR